MLELIDNKLSASHMKVIKNPDLQKALLALEVQSVRTAFFFFALCSHIKTWHRSSLHINLVCYIKGPARRLKRRCFLTRVRENTNPPTFSSILIHFNSIRGKPEVQHLPPIHRRHCVPQELDQISRWSGDKRYLEEFPSMYVDCRWCSYVSGNTGTKSVYAMFESYEVMFHVSTLLPYSGTVS